MAQTAAGLLGLMLRLNILTHIRFFSQLFRFTLVITDCVYEDNCQNGYFEKIFVCVFVCCNKSSDTVCDPTGTDDSGGAIRDRLNALDQAFRFPWSAMAVQLCTARAGFSHCPEERSFHSTDWPMPRDERLNTRFCVYRDLRNKGFYLTSAGKFGGDFLVYPGMFVSTRPICSLIMYFRWSLTLEIFILQVILCVSMLISLHYASPWMKSCLSVIF